MSNRPISTSRNRSVRHAYLWQLRSCSVPEVIDRKQKTFFIDRYLANQIYLLGDPLLNLPNVVVCIDPPHFYFSTHTRSAIA
jgi:hypothetical protein